MKKMLKDYRSFCDLHTHSNCSDGANTPEELVEMAEQLSLSAIALCDHNTVSGLQRFYDAAADKTVEAVPGIEITSDYNGKEIHILGLFIQPKYFGKVTEYVSKISEFKQQSNLKLAENLRRAGIKVEYNKVVEKANGGFVNRVHFAKEIINSGYAESVSEAFERFLNEDKGYYIPAKRLDAFDVIEFLTTIEAVPVIAHPLLNLTYEDLLEFLPKAKQKGLVGLETDYSLFTEQQTQMAMKLAEQFGLLKSGGSDFHGSNKPNIHMGFGQGNLSVPTEYYEFLKEKRYKTENGIPC